jgi:hypothetical protein
MTEVNVTPLARSGGSRAKLARLKVGDTIVLRIVTDSLDIHALGPVVEVEDGAVFADLLNIPDRIPRVELIVGDHLPAMPGSTVAMSTPPGSTVAVHGVRVGDKVQVTETRGMTATRSVGYVGETGSAEGTNWGGGGFRVGSTWFTADRLRFVGARGVVRLAAAEDGVWEVRVRPVNSPARRKWVANANMLNHRGQIVLDEIVADSPEAAVKAATRQIRQIHKRGGRGDLRIVVVDEARKPPKYEIRPVKRGELWNAPVYVRWDSRPARWDLVDDDVAGVGGHDGMHRAVQEARRGIPTHADGEYREPPEVTVAAPTTADNPTYGS